MELPQQPNEEQLLQQENQDNSMDIELQQIYEDLAQIDQVLNTSQIIFMKANQCVQAITDLFYIIQSYQIFMALKSMISFIYGMLFLRDSFCSYELLLITIFLRDIIVLIDNYIYMKILVKLKRQYKKKIMPNANQLANVLNLSYQLNDLLDEDINSLMVFRIVYAFYPKMFIIDLVLLKIFFVQCLLSIYMVYLRFSKDLGQCQTYTIYIITIELLLFYLILFIIIVTIVVFVIFFSIIFFKQLYFKMQDKFQKYKRQKRIQQLKPVNFSQIKHQINSALCPICLVDYTQDNDKIIVLSCNSNHHFHEKCIQEWLKLKGQCPLCRQMF